MENDFKVYGISDGTVALIAMHVTLEIYPAFLTATYLGSGSYEFCERLGNIWKKAFEFGAKYSTESVTNTDKIKDWNNRYAG